MNSVTPRERTMLGPQPLTAAAFAHFGDVIEAAGADALRADLINEGMAERFRDLAAIDVGAERGRLTVDIFRARPWPRPVQVRVMERHPLASQAFIPMTGQPFMVVVADTAGPPAAADLHVFVTNGRQGVNFRRGLWHHPLLVLDRPCELLVLDRAGPGDNLEEVALLDRGIFIDV